MELTSSSLQLLASGTAAVGSLVGGFAQASATRRDAKIADQNADIAEDQARSRQDMIRREARKLKGSQRAALGASGVTLDGSGFDVMEDSAIEAELDALTAGYEGKLQSRAYRSEADASRRSARNSIFQGTIGAGAQALSGYGAWRQLTAAATIPGET